MALIRQLIGHIKPLPRIALFSHITDTSAAVRLALGETQLVAETRNFLETNGVYLEAFNKAPKMRSKTCILLKNLPANTTQDEIRPLFEKHGQIARFIMPKHGITALIEFVEPYEAKNAFTKLAYSQFKTTPLYLEWAPDNVFLKQTNKIELPDDKNTEVKNKEEETIKQEVDDKIIQKNEVKEDFETSLEEPELDTTLFVKNLNFKTTEETLRSTASPGMIGWPAARRVAAQSICHFAVCGKLHSVTIAKKKDPKHPGQFLSMGYGFIQYYSKSHTNEALKSLQYSILDDKTLELKRSEKGSTAFGEIKSLRLPKKLTPGSDQHRGFAFVDYHSKSDAKVYLIPSLLTSDPKLSMVSDECILLLKHLKTPNNNYIDKEEGNLTGLSAFEALCQSTHLYGRRLVLEWADLIDETEGVETLRKRTAQLFNTKAPGGKKSKKATVDSEQFVEAYTE
ncbi:Probable RNA-binding protein 19 [Eumeta japonica]|uniref:Probable RNA-binding protein 19 n=1 Tax=Eumeta variegata TaxID=151549 RepID=A0A4C1Y461_EUMVA|nr:Probable RNA-binding protein 19 [Eumeta japonica]